MPTLMLLNPQIYQAPKSVIMNYRVHYFHDLGLSYFYHIKTMSMIRADHLQWTIYVKTKSRVYMCIKNWQKNFQVITKLSDNHEHEKLPTLNNSESKNNTNTNTKSPMLLTQLVLLHQINCKTNATIVILSPKNRKNTSGALIDNYEKVSFVLVMYLFPQSSSILYLF